MKTITKTYITYSFDELSQESQNNALSQVVEFIYKISADYYFKANDEFKRLAEVLQPYYDKHELIDEVISECKQYIIKAISTSDYIFLYNGAFINDKLDQLEETN